MIKIHRVVPFILTISIILNACVPQRKLIYIQDSGPQKPDLKEFEIDRVSTEEIQPGDELYIRVTSSDETPTNFSESASRYGVLDITLLSYTVDDDGYINFPYLGNLSVHGKSLKDVEAEINEALKDFLLSPSVIVKFVNKKVTVVGEVGAPGVYTFYDKNINILQAIAHAGDISTFGNRKNVVLLREGNNKILKYRIDLTSEEVLLSDTYIVKPDDIIYVEPLRIKKWGFETFPYTLVFTVINSTLIIYSLILSLY